MLKFHDGRCYLGDLIMTVEELAAIRPGFSVPAGTVEYHPGKSHKRNKDGNQTAGPDEWLEADTLLAEETTIATELDALRAPAPLTLDEFKTEARATVNIAAEAERLKYVTGGAAMAAVYRAKQGEAEAIQAILDGGGELDPPKYPLANGRATRLGTNLTLVAAEWLAKRDAWLNLAAAIEDVREGAIEAVAVATDDSEIQTILDGLTWPSPT